MRPVALLAAALGLLVLMGCSGLLSDVSPFEDGPVVVATASERVEFEFPPGWYENPDEHPFDLQVFSRFQKMNTGVYEWSRADLARDVEPRQLLDLQIADLASKRDTFDVHIPERTQSFGDKAITYVTYAGEKGLTRYLYTFSLVEFTAHSDVVVVTLQVSFPSNWDEDRPILEGIVETAQVRVAEDAGGTPDLPPG